MLPAESLMLMLLVLKFSVLYLRLISGVSVSLDMFISAFMLPCISLNISFIFGIFAFMLIVLFGIGCARKSILLLL